MTKKKKLLAAGLLLITLASCATDAKRAKSALESENYDEAINIYRQMLTEDPSDADASAGLRAAQNGFLDKKLIQTRMARLAENWPDSLSLLSLVLTKEKEWKIAPAGKVAFTQEEETGYAISYSRRYTSAATQAHHPLAAEDFFTTYKPIFDDRNDDSLKASQAEIQASGLAECKSVRKMSGPKTPHFDLMASQFCLHYGVSEKNQKLLDASEKAIHESLMSGLQLNFAKESLNETQQGDLREAVRASFQKTAWYDPKGAQLLALNVSGKFSENHTRTGTVLVQDYQEPEQYVEQVMVTRMVDVPYTEYQSNYNPVTKNFDQVPVTRTRQEPISEYQPQERTRYVTRSYRYPAWKHDQTLTLTTELSGTLADTPLQFTLNESGHADGIEHDENQPSMGLTPARPNLLDPAKWEKEQFSKFAPKFEARAVELWRARFCADFTGKTAAETGEKVLLCMRQIGQPMPAAADQWASAEFGVKAIRIQEILGRE